MSQAQAVSPLVLAFVAGGFTTFGVVLKIGYDAIAARRMTRAARLERFADERRQVYEKFYDLTQRQLRRDTAMFALLEAHRKGKKTALSDEEKENFPPVVLDELIATAEEIRRLARIYSVIAAAEAIVRPFVDMTRAARATLDNPDPNDEVTWFLLQRFLEDRISEFVHGYREDLGLGPPKGAPKTWPVEPRKFPMSMTRNQSEALLRAHIRPRAKKAPPAQLSRSNGRWQRRRAWSPVVPATSIRTGRLASEVPGDRRALGLDAGEDRVDDLIVVTVVRRWPRLKA